MNTVSYRKARTQEPEFEPCILISVSTGRRCGQECVFSLGENIRKIKGGYFPEYTCSRPLCRACSYYVTLGQEIHFSTGTVRVTLVSIQAICRNKLKSAC